MMSRAKPVSLMTGTTLHIMASIAGIGPPSSEEAEQSTSNSAYQRGNSS